MTLKSVGDVCRLGCCKQNFDSTKVNQVEENSQELGKVQILKVALKKVTDRLKLWWELSSS